MKRKVEAALNALGWKTSIAHSIVVKDVETIVGNKEASIHFGDAGFIWMYAEYWSIGRNILCDANLRISLTASQDEVEKKVANFVTSINKVIDRSYARHIYLEEKMEAANA